MMRGHVRFETQRAVMERDFLEDSGIEEHLQVFVNGTQGNRRDPLPDLLVDQLRGRMFTRIDNGFVDDLTLESKGEALFLTAAAEVVKRLRTHVFHEY